MGVESETAHLLIRSGVKGANRLGVKGCAITAVLDIGNEQVNQCLAAILNR